MFSAISNFIFTTSSLFSGHHQLDGTGSSTWKDKRLCFDLRSSDLELDRGEQLIACFYPVEDVKGNQDELGLLRITNLRLVWICCRKKRVNLSIGWRTVTFAYEQKLKDALCGSASSLFVLSKYDSVKYEFVFGKKLGQNDLWVRIGSGYSGEEWTSIAQLKKFAQDKPSLVTHLSPMYLDEPFEVVFKVWQAYKQSHLFRHCRSNLTQLISTQSRTNQPVSGESNFTFEDINKLPSEEIIDIFSGFTQIESKSTKHLGTLVLTDVRIIWIDDALPLRNLSIPYIRLNSIKFKQGNKVIINAHDYLANSTHVDFQINKSPVGSNKPAKLIAEQLQNLSALYKAKPRYGPESFADCINFKSHLKPIGHLFESIDQTLGGSIENLGPAVRSEARDTLISSVTVSNDETRRANQENYDNDIDELESDLDGYKTKLTSYLNEQPLDFDKDVTYSTDLGLAVERPANASSLRTIWRLEI